MREYELMYIIRPDRDEEEIAALVERIGELIESLGGKVDGVVQSDPWGRRRLAYEIDDHEEGYYVLCHFSLDADHLEELERVLKLTEAILRYMLTRRVGQ
ncbi:MAG: 30S ribosomal protein S6 [Chloroflexia bacterium]|nr:30S ribosomal protein S6 [Chloroflexia bacterium]